MGSIPHILVTNDDGIHAPGLLALAREMKGLGRVSVLAPDHNWSASGHVKTLHRPLRVREVELEEGVTALASDGAPSDCVALAVLGLTDEIDLVVSGINPHANLGHDVTYSGTVTAAMEAVIWDIPGLAVSVDAAENHFGKLDYQPSAAIAFQVARMVLRGTLPLDVVYNLNVPDLPAEKIKGIQVTRQGLREYRDELVTRKDPRGTPYYWIGGDPPTGAPDRGTDIGALAAGYASLTPLALDLTAEHVFEQIRQQVDQDGLSWS
ncbi:MAG: 5'/3'-nucleotidase SurE [Anaerolineales bacterium]